MSARPLYALLAALSIVAGACNLDAPRLIASPTTVVRVIATPAPPPSASPPPLSPAPSATLHVVAPMPADTPTPDPPSPSPTATLPWFEYLVQEGETLFYILQLPQHGYAYEPDVAATVVALNPNIPNADSVSGGITIRIPRPTASPTAAGAPATQALLATIGFDSSSGAILDAGASVGCHQVIANDSMVTIAHTYETTLEILSDLNQGEVDWYGCNFTLPGGGPDCAPNLRIGQCVRVPQPSPTPTRFPTPRGDETATPAATKLAPRLLYPADGAVVPAGPVILQWLSQSGMRADEVYLVEMTDQTTNTAFRQVTRANAYRAPALIFPAIDGPRLVQWSVTVARRNEMDQYYYAGAAGRPSVFHWSSG